MRQSSERPLTPEETHAARIAMAARAETDAALAGISKQFANRKWALEQAVTALHQSGTPPVLIRGDDQVSVSFPLIELAEAIVKFTTSI